MQAATLDQGISLKTWHYDQGIRLHQTSIRLGPPQQASREEKLCCLTAGLGGLGKCGT